MNGILYYAIEQEIIEHNPLNDINYGNLPYKANNTEIIPFSEEERLQVIYFLGETDIDIVNQIISDKNINEAKELDSGQHL